MNTSSGWTEVRLGDIVEFKYGKSLPARRRIGAGYPVFGSNGEVGRHSDAVTAGTTIIVGRKGSFGEVAWSDGPCWPIDTTYYIDGAATKADLRWLYHRLQALPIKDLNRAAAVPGLNREDAYSLALLLPPIKEQRRIAAVLDAADGLRTKRREALDKLDTLTQGIFIDMFGEPASGQTPLVPLEQVVGAAVTRGIDQPGPDVPGGVPYLKTTDFGEAKPRREALARASDEIARKFPRSVVSAGDTVICIRATVGPTMYVTEELAGVNLSRGTARVSPSEEVLPRYLFAALKSQHFQRQVREKLRGATFLQIPLKELKQLRVPLPSLVHQCEFVGIAEAVEAQLDAARHGLASLDVLFASLQQRAFRGEL